MTQDRPTGGSWARRLRRRVTAARRTAPDPAPLLTVVVVVRGPGAYLPACVASVEEHVARDGLPVEVLLVAEPADPADATGPAGPADPAGPPEGDAAGRVGPPLAPWPEELLSGVAGRYLTFVDVDDLVLDGLAGLVGSLEVSGSDLALGRVRRARSAQVRRLAEPPPPEPGTGLTVRDRPELLAHAPAAGWVFRTAAAARSWDCGSGEELAGLVVARLLEDRVDVVDVPVQELHARDVSLPIASQRRFRAEPARRRTAALVAAGESLRARDADLHRRWCVDVATWLLPGLTRDSVGGGEAHFAAVASLARAVRAGLAEAAPAALAEVPVEARLLLHVAAYAGLREVALTHDVLADHPHGLPFSTGPDADRVDVAIEGWEPFPDEVLAVQPVDRVLHAEVVADVDPAAGALVLRGWAFRDYTPGEGPPEVRLRLPRGAEVQADNVLAVRDVAHDLAAGRAFEDHTGCGFGASLDLARLDGSDGSGGPEASGTVTVTLGDVVATRAVTWAAGPTTGPDAGAATGPTGGQPPAATVDTVEVTGRTLVLHGSGTAPAAVTLEGPRGTAGPAPVVTTPGGWRAEVSLTTELFGDPVDLPAGRYALRAVGEDGHALPVGWGRPVPAGRWLTDRFALHCDTGPRGALVVLAAPLTDEERGPRQQQRLLTGFRGARASGPREDLVLLESFRGRSVGDNPGALARELRRRGPSLDLAWVVDDPSVRVPDGMRAVPRHTAGWYDALARARVHISNAGAPGWFTKPPHQLHLQTWHGTPLKRIGEDRGPGDFATWRHRRHMAAQAAGWDALVSPSAFCTPILRRAFGFENQVLEVGYPRNDLLLDPDRGEQVRRRLREVLGIAAGERAVLYAPTWREYVGVRDAKPLFLDADRLLARLPDAVVLLRGHYNSTTQADVFRDHPRIHDVTRYPDIADLYLAADALVTDYSSVMFDFALTDKPVVLLTPDLDQYRDVERGFYFDLEARRPGPLVSTTDEVAAVLAAGDAHAADRAAFREVFCPLDDGHASQRVVDHLMAVW